MKHSVQDKGTLLLALIALVTFSDVRKLFT